MRVLEKVEPIAVFNYFEDICSIPHGSGNMTGISNYLVKFAKDRNIKFIQDKYKNIVMFKEASKGYEDLPPVILQGHMDMVAVKDEGVRVDMMRSPLRLVISGDKIYSKGTSLGGDDGIAVAYMLAILDDDKINHPPIEAVFTTDEEAGLIGISHMDLSVLNGRQLINIDSEEEGVMITACAGGMKARCMIHVNYGRKCGRLFRLSVSGLIGGHSGVEIDKQRGNANCIIARVLNTLSERMPYSLVDIRGGEKDNIIPKSSSAVIVVDDEECVINMLNETIEELGNTLRHELEFSDKGVRLDLEDMGYNQADVLNYESFKRALTFLNMLPNGVQAMSCSIPGLVETSCSVAIVALEGDSLKVRVSIRSSINSAKKNLKDKISSFAEYMDGYVTYEGDYPPWEYKADSPLRDKMLKIYEDMYGKEMKVSAIHGGVECGYISDRIEGIDCVSIGPDMFNVHTTKESLSISSVQRVWSYLLRVLEIK